MIESSATHDKARHAKASLHDNVAPCCVVTKEATRAQQVLGARATDLDNDRKKKKFHENWGITV